MEPSQDQNTSPATPPQPNQVFSPNMPQQEPAAPQPIAPVAPLPTVVSVAQPNPTATSDTKTSSAQLLYNSRRSTKSIVTTIIAIVISLGVVAAAILWMVATSGGVKFSPLQNRQGEFYTISIPEGWNEEFNTNTAVYRDGESAQDSQVQLALIRGQVIPNYSTAANPQKDQYVNEISTEVVDSLREQLEAQLKSVNDIETTFDTHPNSDRSIKMLFSGINENDLQVNGISYYFIDDSGRTYFLISVATNNLWKSNSSDIEKMVLSFNPAEQ